ncbi:DUF6119 family protein [Saccharopolyspora phatthalungensis]|uniref:Uncharacterized protein (TIGR04141 family) n=1 Tax=Saccharopolyspora phatthalungensis TaxID=664693 RepID=A0A840PX47_9PSEU|nr:DUF6119 family protein [Saccharopolyspora phatthalungensis]MBB5152886.1 uncharacterized protein (TIGR04141 family) [Saccharopolyspora phatthalungensis]
MATNTSKHTLYRLIGVPATPDGLRKALDHDRLDALDHTVQEAPYFTELDIPALLVTVNDVRDQAEWCPEVRRTTGCDVAEPSWRSSAVLVLAVDGQVYAIGFDQGFRLIPDRLKDTNFGLTFALRAVDPNAVFGMTSKVLGEGRTDITMIAGGAPVSRLGVKEYLRIVRKVAGEIHGVALTRTRLGNDTLVRVDGGYGLQLPLGIEAKNLVADIREVARVCRQNSPHRALEFIEHVRPVRDEATVEELDRVLDDVLGDPASGLVTAAMPYNRLDEIAEARNYRIKISKSEWRHSDEFDLEYVLKRLGMHRPGHRVPALRDAEVALFRRVGDRASNDLATDPLIRWLEANLLSIGSRRFHLTDNQWYEIGERYLPEIVNTVTRVIRPKASVELPKWMPGEEESDYNENAPKRCPDAGYVCLDKKKVRNPLKSPDTLEVCDLLAADGTMVMVKQASASDALSHLFHQGLVAVQMLLESAEVRERFARKVHDVSGRVIPKDFKPKRVVFAILLKKGVDLTPDTLFAFSQVALAQTVKLLEERGVEVEVVGIEADAADEVHDVAA